MLICVIRVIRGKKVPLQGKIQKYFLTFAALSQTAGMVPAEKMETIFIKKEKQ